MNYYTFGVEQPGHWVFAVEQQFAAADAAGAVAVVADGDADTVDDFAECLFSLIWYAHQFFLEEFCFDYNNPPLSAPFEWI